MSIISKVLGVSLMLAGVNDLPIPPTETVTIDSALIVRGLDYVNRIDNINIIEFYSEDFERYAYNEAEYTFSYNQAFLIGDIENAVTGETTTYFIDLYNTNLSTGLLVFNDNDAELRFKNIPSVYVAFRNATIKDLFNDYVGVGYTAVSTTNIITDYGGVYSNNVIVPVSYWYNLGYENGYFDGTKTADYHLPWLDVFNQFFTFEFIPGLKFYYILLFGLGVTVLGAVVKRVM